MRYFIDTEYDWHPTTGHIVPISIGIVAQDGREYYAIHDHVLTPVWQAECSLFVTDHVLPVLNATSRDPRRFPAKPITWIRDDIKRFIGDDTPEFWGDYAAFDYVVLSMLMGDFSDWPQGWPMHFNDCRQEAIPELPSRAPHHALADARAIRDSWNAAFESSPAHRLPPASH